MEYNKQKDERANDLYNNKEQDSPYISGEKKSSNDVFGDPVSSFKQMNRERKVALGILSAFSLLIIIIFFINLRNDIKKPFVIPGVETSSEKTSCADGNCSSDENNLSSENMDLKLVDTDGDTISDWDELFVHGTSPYLEDTDGDNLTDYEEIFAYKTDPVCPQGQNCSSSVTSSSSQNDGSNIVGDDLLNSLNSNGATAIQGQTLDAETVSKFYNIDPAELRTQLIGAGFSKDEIDMIGDQELLDIYRQSLYQSMETNK